MYIRQMIAKLIWKFDFAFAPREHWASLERDASDAFMMTYSKLRPTLKLKVIL